MIDGPDQRPGVGELMGCVWVLLPFPLEAVQFVEEIVVVNVKFMRVYANNGT